MNEEDVGFLCTAAGNHTAPPERPETKTTMTQSQCCSGSQGLCRPISLAAAVRSQRCSRVVGMFRSGSQATKSKSFNSAANCVRRHLSQAQKHTNTVCIIYIYILCIYIYTHAHTEDPWRSAPESFYMRKPLRCGIPPGGTLNPKATVARRMPAGLTWKESPGMSGQSSSTAASM